MLNLAVLVSTLYDRFTRLNLAITEPEVPVLLVRLCECTFVTVYTEKDIF